MENAQELGSPQSITLRPDDLDDLLTRAAERGAELRAAAAGVRETPLAREAGLRGVGLRAAIQQN